MPPIASTSLQSTTVDPPHRWPPTSLISSNRRAHLESHHCERLPAFDLGPRSGNRTELHTRYQRRCSSSCLELDVRGLGLALRRLFCPDLCRRRGRRLRSGGGALPRGPEAPRRRLRRGAGVGAPSASARLVVAQCGGALSATMAAWVAMAPASERPMRWQRESSGGGSDLVDCFALPAFQDHRPTSPVGPNSGQSWPCPD